MTEKITPEMAWDWFCERMFEGDRSFNKIGIFQTLHDGNAIFAINSSGTRDLILRTRMVKHLGWQDMPERVRND